MYHSVGPMVSATFSVVAFLWMHLCGRVSMIDRSAHRKDAPRASGGAGWNQQYVQKRWDALRRRTFHQIVERSQLLIRNRPYLQPAVPAPHHR